MLISFSVENYGPFKQPVTLQMSPGSSRSKDEHIKGDCLPVAAIFGANASGKSSLVNALKTMRDFIINPYFSTNAPIHCWDSKNDVSRFEVVISVNGIQYTYRLAMKPSAEEEGRSKKGKITYSVAWEEIFRGDGIDPKTGEIIDRQISIVDNLDSESPDNIEWNRVISEIEDSKTKLEEISDSVDEYDEIISMLQEDIDKDLELKHHINSIHGRPKDDDNDDTRFVDAELEELRAGLIEVEEERDELAALMEIESSNLERLRIERDKLMEERERTIPLRGLLRKEYTTEQKLYLEAIRDIRQWFVGSLVIIGTGDYYLPLSNKNLLDDLNRALCSFDVGIKGLGWEKIPDATLDDVMLSDDYNMLRLGTNLANSAQYQYKFSMIVKHRNDILKITGYNGKATAERLVAYHDNDSASPMPLSAESDGTRRIIDLASMLVPTDEETTFVVDEINRRLHPLLTVAIIKQFLARADAPKQLILTTHETHLMTTDLFRLDEIWAIDNPNGRPVLIPFDELKMRNDSRLDKLYLIDCVLPGIPRIDE